MNKQKLKVANVVLNNFTTDNRVYKIARTLLENNYDLTVVALLKGNVPASEIKDGVPVQRIALKTMTLPEGTLFGLIKFMEIIYKVVRDYRSYDIWHCNDIEAFGIGVVAKFFRPKLKLVYDCHEFEGERNGRSKLERWLVRRFESLFIHKAEEVITVSPSIAQAYKDRYGVKDVWLVRNVPHQMGEAPKKNLFREKFNIPAHERIFLYQGAFTYNRGLEEAVEAFEGISGAHLVCMGYGVFLDKVLAAAERCPNIHYMPAVPYNQVLEHTASADVGLLSVRPTCLSYLYCLPNKLFEYIQAGIPIVSNNLPDCRTLIEQYQIGWVLDEYTPESIRNKVEELRDADISVFASGLKRAASELMWEVEERALVAVYERV
ncbi:MAG: hypothetical protein RL226_2414 [Bacteroidota bacterium]